MQVKVALPKGSLVAPTAALLQKVGWGLGGYTPSARLYRLASDAFPGLSGKILKERDIPIHVSIGNYDLGICGLDWVEELLAKYPQSRLKIVGGLAYGGGSLYMVAAQGGGGGGGVVRLAGEYPNIAELAALKLRLKRFSVFPLWGGAEVYPPENADIALIRGEVGQEEFGPDLKAVGEVLAFSAVLIANTDSYQSPDVRRLVDTLKNELRGVEAGLADIEGLDVSSALGGGGACQSDGEAVRLALPDGHQQEPTVELLQKAGIEMEDYPSPTGNRRPRALMDGVTVKVVRPQDMPLQVANGCFDLAVTGRDWLTDHLYQFPSSPVAELLGLGFGGVRIVTVVGGDMPASDSYELRHYAAQCKVPLRVASEYTHIADKYARDNHLGRYRVIPTWGATEAFLPEDADMLIENTQTGATIARNKLKIIDTLFHSTACLVGNTASLASPGKRAVMDSIVGKLKGVVNHG